MLLPRPPIVAGALPLLAVLLLCAVAAVAAEDGASVQAALKAAAQKAAAPAVSPSPDAVPSAPPASATPASPEREGGEEAPRIPDSLYSTAYQGCMDEAAGVTTAMQGCMEVEQTRLERHTVDLRGRLAQALPQERAAALVKALEAWESLRQNGSVAMYAPEGGSLSPLMASLWYLEQTARMARWLEGLTENLDQ